MTNTNNPVWGESLFDNQDDYAQCAGCSDYFLKEELLNKKEGRIQFLLCEECSKERKAVRRIERNEARKQANK